VNNYTAEYDYYTNSLHNQYGYYNKEAYKMITKVTSSLKQAETVFLKLQAGVSIYDLLVDEVITKPQYTKLTEQFTTKKEV
jgi:hypothetical protein